MYHLMQQGHLRHFQRRAVDRVNAYEEVIGLFVGNRLMDLRAIGVAILNRLPAQNDVFRRKLAVEVAAVELSVPAGKQGVGSHKGLNQAVSNQRSAVSTQQRPFKISPPWLIAEC